MLYTEIVVLLFVGLVLGSFATALSYRVPRKQNWISKRSACTSCKTHLGFLDLVPFFSWLFSGGKCRHCGQVVSWIYPSIELGTAIAVLGVYVVFGMSVEALFIIALIPFLAALLVIDFQKMLLPNQLVFVCFCIGFARIFYFSTTDAFSGAAELLVPYFAGAIVYVLLSAFLRLVLTVLMKKEALGLGDVKFFFVCGLWLGLYDLPLFFILTGSIGLFMALFWRIIMKQKPFPFGPALIASLYALLLLQGPVLT